MMHQFGLRSVLLASFVLGSFSISSNSFALSAPWVLFQNEVKATVGDDACVLVSDLKTAPEGYVLNVQVCELTKAKALSTLLTQTKAFGNVKVEVAVLDGNGALVPKGEFPTEPTAAATLFQTALQSNCQFVKVDQGNRLYTFFVQFNKALVSYAADNLADPQGKIVKTAADAFADVLNLSSLTGISIGTSTSTFFVHGGCEGR